ncbi:MAG: hypothetical protein BJ554DRAFT_4737, partial [Olpidium bornovanus]
LQADEVRDLFHRFGVEIHLTVAYNPEANGKAKRGYQTFVDALVKAAKFESAKWVDLFPFALWADQSTTHRMIGFAPVELMHRNRPSLPVEDALVTWSVLPWGDSLSCEELLTTDVKDRIAGKRLKAFRRREGVDDEDGASAEGEERRKKAIKWDAPETVSLAFPAASADGAGYGASGGLEAGFEVGACWVNGR